MVNIKALIFVPVSLMTTAVMAQSSANGPQIAEVEASASIALADMASVANIPMDTILQKLEKAEDYEEDASEGTGDVTTGIIWPPSFGELCIILTNVSKKLDYLLDIRAQNGAHCPQEIKNINSTASCKTPVFLSSILWPLALNDFQNTAAKIHAQTFCLKKLITGQ